MRATRTVLAAIITCASALPGALARADGLPQASDLRADAAAAARRSIPLLILFSSPACSYCERVRGEYLAPLHADPAFARRVIVREISVGLDTPLTGFDGSPTTAAAFAADAGIRIVPTVKVYDARGHAAGEPLVGLLGADFYYGYLLEAIELGTRQSRATPEENCP